MEQLPELSQEKYELLAERYWVLAWKDEHDKPLWFHWLLSVKEPRPVMNPGMYWRRPTYQEALRRQEAFDYDSKHFAEYCEKCSLRKYDVA